MKEKGFNIIVIRKLKNTNLGIKNSGAKSNNFFIQHARLEND